MATISHLTVAGTTYDLPDKATSITIPSLVYGGATKIWVKVATITNFTAQGAFANITCFYGAGNNGKAEQNNKLDIIMQRGWSGESTNSQVGTLVIAYNPVYSSGDARSVRPKVKVLSEDNINYDVWVYTNWTYSKLNTYVAVTNTASYEIGGDSQSEEPTGTYTQPVTIKDLYNSYISHSYEQDVNSSNIDTIMEAGSYHFNNSLSEVFGNNAWGLLFVIHENIWTTQIAICNYAPSGDKAQIYVRNTPNNTPSWEAWRPIFTNTATSSKSGFMTSSDKTNLDNTVTTIGTATLTTDAQTLSGAINEIDSRLDGTVLWSGNSYDDLTLTDNITNYSRLKIVYGDDGYGYRTEELDLTVGTKARLELSYINNSSYFQRTALLSFSGTSVTMTQQAGASTAYGSTMVYQSGYKIYIRKIIGFKN